MLIIYNLLATTLFVLTLPWLLVTPFWRKHWLGERLGIKAKERFAPLKNRRPFWIHAASVGEVSAVAPLVSEIKAKFPNVPVVISTTTPTGLERARRTIREADIFTILPFDLIFILLYVFALAKPKALLLVELELWPNLIWTAKRLGCRLALVNGRLTPKAYSSYRLIRGFVEKILKEVDFFCLQSETDRERFFRLGVSPAKTAVVGSLKFDAPLGKPVQLPIPGDRQVVVAGSTREGEEEVLLEAFASLRKDFDRLLLILAPRHLDRVPKVEALVSKAGFTKARRSHLDSISPDIDVVILDTMGELASVYARAQVAFVGGSLVPLGGHNPLEPAAWGVPVLFGPYMNQEGAKTLLERDAAFQVKDAAELAHIISELLRNPSKRAAAGSQAKKVVEERKGSTSTTVRLLQENGIL